VTFEEFKADPWAVVQKVADFIQCGASEEVIQKTVEASSFDQMKKNHEENTKEKIKEGKPHKVNHIRQGLSGAWRKVLTKEQEAALFAVHNERSVKYELPLDLFDF